MGCRLPFDRDRIAGADASPDHHDAHDSGLSDEVAAVIASKHCREKTFAMVVDLRAGIAQPRDLHLGRLANPQETSFGETKQIETDRRDVLPQLARCHLEALRREFVEKLGMQKMNLTKVGLGGVLTYAGTMLHRFTAVRVSLDAKSGQEVDRIGAHLGERMRSEKADGDNSGGHRAVSKVSQ